MSGPPYLESERMDDLARMIAELASEVWILRDRTLRLEHLLDERGCVAPLALDELRPSGDLLERITSERGDFVRRVFGAVLDNDLRTSAALEDAIIRQRAASRINPDARDCSAAATPSPSGSDVPHVVGLRDARTAEADPGDGLATP